MMMTMLVMMVMVMVMVSYDDGFRVTPKTPICQPRENRHRHMFDMALRSNICYDRVWWRCWHLDDCTHGNVDRNARTLNERRTHRRAVGIKVNTHSRRNAIWILTSFNDYIKRVAITSFHSRAIGNREGCTGGLGCWALRLRPQLVAAA